MMDKFVIGIDFGTDSCRTLLVNARTGGEIASSVEYYPRWQKGLYCDPAQNRYRQHPLDYIESMEAAVRTLLAGCPIGIAAQVAGISVDTTGSTPVVLNRAGIPLALLPEYSENPDAMFILWKDHTAIGEAEEINRRAKEWPVDYTDYSGGIYSPEWVWAKMLHILRSDETIRRNAYSWVEHCDWMPALLTGNRIPEHMYRSRCAAGHKAMWNEAWGGLPDFGFWERIDPLFGVFKGHLYRHTCTSDTRAGFLTAEWAKRLGLPASVAVGVGALDCHFGAVGAEITERTFVRVMGTSTCDVMVSSYDEIRNKRIGGICGQVDGSVLPGRVGLEAGQSAFGDVYAWFKQVLAWPARQLVPVLLGEEKGAELVKEMEEKMLTVLTAEAGKIPFSHSSPLAVDWLNGRRTPFANPAVSGALSGLTLGTTAPLIFRSLVEATAFGSKAIVDSFLSQGIGIDRITAIGGISRKSPFVMQVLADVLGMPIQVARTREACALGAAMFASLAAGIYPDIKEAQQKLGKGFSVTYEPDRSKAEYYSALYERYQKLGMFIEENQ